MKLTNNKAKKILDFLAKRMGYESWRFIDSLTDNLKTIEFLDEKHFGVDLLIEKNGNLKICFFYNDQSVKDILKSMIENQDHVYCSFNHSYGCDKYKLPCEELRASFPWIYVFKKNESLESLLIESDLNG